MILEHFTPEPLMMDFDREYSQMEKFHKPRGFWVSVKGEDDWRAWCVDNEWGRNEYVSTVELKKDANILYLTTVDELLAFHEEYKTDLNPGSMYPIWYIDWTLVVPKYDGIIIAPYQWDLRLSSKMSWYYSWDVASGCIWNLGVIESISPSMENLETQREIENV